MLMGRVPHSVASVKTQKFSKITDATEPQSLRGIGSTQGPYRLQLFKALAEFQIFLGPSRVHLASLARSAPSMSEALARFVETCFAKGPSFISRAKLAILAIQQKFPDLRGSLKLPWNVLRAWQRRVPTKNRVPVPYQVFQALVGASLLTAAETPFRDRHRWFTFHLMLLCCFHGLLRPAEFLHLCSDDLRVSPFEDNKLVLVLRDTKTRDHMGKLQHVLIEDASTVAFARWHLKNHPSGAPIWPFSDSLARGCLLRLLTRLQLSASGFTLASFRAGGATHLYTQGCDISRLMFRGRWKVLGTLHCYIQEATW